MTWGKMDDKFHRNPKVRAARRMKGGRAALGDWAFWWSWCLDDPSLTGVVPSLELDANEQKSAVILVTAGLWEPVDGGFRFHDFHEYNPTREQREAKKAADRDRVAENRKASREHVASDTDASRERVASTRVSRPVPSHSQRERDARALEPASPEPNQTLTAIPADRFAASLVPATGVPIATIAAWFSAHRSAAGHGKWTWIRRGYGPDFDTLTKISAHLAGEANPEAVFADACRGFWGDEKARTAGYPISFLAADVGRYVARGSASGGSTAAAAEREVIRLRDAIRAAIGGDPETEARLQSEYLAAQKRIAGAA